MSYWPVVSPESSMEGAWHVMFPSSCAACFEEVAYYQWCFALFQL